MVKSNVTKTTSKVSLFLQSEIKSLFRKYERKKLKKNGSQKLLHFYWNYDGSEGVKWSIGFRISRNLILISRNFNDISHH